MKIGIEVITDQLESLKILYSFSFSFLVGYNFDQPQGLYLKVNFMMNV